MCVCGGGIRCPAAHGVPWPVGPSARAGPCAAGREVLEPGCGGVPARTPGAPEGNRGEGGLSSESGCPGHLFGDALLCTPFSPSMVKTFVGDGNHGG